MKNKLFYILIIISILGLYIGFGHDSLCNGSYRQEMIDISIVEPFVPKIYHVFLGIGKHRYENLVDEWIDLDGKKYVNHHGCANYHYGFVRGPIYFDEYKMFIDLRLKD